jgi:hypothetical protein
MQYRQPIPSIRLKAQRRGLQDYEYCWLLVKKKGGNRVVDDFVNSVCVQEAVWEAGDARRRNLEKQPGGMGPRPHSGWR